MFNLYKFRKPEVQGKSFCVRAFSDNGHYCASYHQASAVNLPEMEPLGNAIQGLPLHQSVLSGLKDFFTQN